FAVMVLEHLPSPRRFWRKLHDVLRPGGVFWGFTMDRRHWFCQASLWADRLQVKELYLNRLAGKRGVDRYENYPVYYRSNSPLQVASQVRAFSSCDLVNFSKIGQLRSYYPPWLRPVGDLMDRRAIRRGRPGTLLAIRVVK